MFQGWRSRRGYWATPPFRRMKPFFRDRSLMPNETGFLLSKPGRPCRCLPPGLRIKNACLTVLCVWKYCSTIKCIIVFMFTNLGQLELCKTRHCLSQEFSTAGHRLLGCQETLIRGHKRNIYKPVNDNNVILKYL